MPQVDVGPDIEIFRKVQFLVDEGNSQVLCGPHVGDLDHLPIDRDFALIWLMNTGKALHESALARPVLPHDSHDFPCMKRGTHPFKSTHSPEALADRAGL